MHMQTRPENRGELGWREALAAKRLPRRGKGRAENPVCLRGGWWWATGPARVPVVEHSPLSTGEKRNDRRGREKKPCVARTAGLCGGGAAARERRADRT